MKIGDSKPVASAQRSGPRSASAAGRSEGSAPALSARDTTSVLGIPEQELTPKVRQAIMTLMAEVDRLRQELEQSQSRFIELERFANLDPLVPVLNRRAFVHEMGRAISFSERYQMPASLIYFDLNNFKDLNDAYGHGAGDAALIQIGQLLRAHVRETDLVGRLGGDEFGVILSSATEDVAYKKAELLAGLIERTAVTWQGDSLGLSAAYGVYGFKPGVDAAAAMAEADRAMFQRKRTSKNGTGRGSNGTNSNAGR